MFAPLRRRETFLAVEIHSEHGTAVRSRGANLDPDGLHARVAGQAPPADEVAEQQS